LHERDRPGAGPRRVVHGRARRPQDADVAADPAAERVGPGGLLQPLEDRLNGVVLELNYIAVKGSDSLGIADRVHDAAAGDEAEALEQPVELPGVALARLRGRLDAGDAPRDALPHLDRGKLQHPAVAVPQRVLVD